MVSALVKFWFMIVAWAMVAFFAAVSLFFVPLGNKYLLLIIPVSLAAFWWLFTRQYRHLFDTTWRQKLWAERVRDEYHSWRLPPIEYMAPHMRTLSQKAVLRMEPSSWSRFLRRVLRLTQTPVHRRVISWVRRPVAGHLVSVQLRLKWARSWARVHELRPLSGYLLVLTSAFILISFALWRAGLIQAHGVQQAARDVLDSTPTIRRNGEAAQLTETQINDVATLGVVAFHVVFDYIWQIIDMIPFVGSDIFGWDRTPLLVNDPLQLVLTLMYRILVFAPMIIYIAHVFQNQDPVEVPTHSFAGAVELAVVGEMVTRETLDWYTLDLRKLGHRLGMTVDQIQVALAREQAAARSRAQEA